jgi:predicted Fe-S protein YdhL (DUF1289 family)
MTKKCTKQCKLNPLTNICEGCLRTMDEIKSAFKTSEKPE